MDLCTFGVKLAPAVPATVLCTSWDLCTGCRLHPFFPPVSFPLATCNGGFYKISSEFNRTCRVDSSNVTSEADPLVAALLSSRTVPYP